MLPTIEQLQQMQTMNIMELERDKLANAEDIVIDTGKSMESRVRSFMEQTGNPFALNVGEYILQVGFFPPLLPYADTGLSHVRNYLISPCYFQVFPCFGKKQIRSQYPASGSGYGIPENFV